MTFGNVVEALKLLLSVLVTVNVCCRAVNDGGHGAEYHGMCRRQDA